MNSDRRGGDTVDNELCEKLYSMHYMKVYSFLMTKTGDPTLSEELAQKTFFKALTSDATFRGESDESTWLCAIAKNVYADELRSRSGKCELSDEVSDKYDMESAVIDKDSSFHIHLALHELREPYREVFELRIFGELSFRQIGTVFGKTESWARVTYHRARLLLQERMGAFEL